MLLWDCQVLCDAINGLTDPPCEASLVVDDTLIPEDLNRGSYAIAQMGLNLKFEGLTLINYFDCT